MIREYPLNRGAIEFLRTKSWPTVRWQSRQSVTSASNARSRASFAQSPGQLVRPHTWRQAMRARPYAVAVKEVRRCRCTAVRTTCRYRSDQEKTGAGVRSRALQHDRCSAPGGPRGEANSGTCLHVVKQLNWRRQGCKRFQKSVDTTRTDKLGKFAKTPDHDTQASFTCWQGAYKLIYKLTCPLVSGHLSKKRWRPTSMDNPNCGSSQMPGCRV